MKLEGNWQRAIGHWQLKKKMFYTFTHKTEIDFVFTPS
jgi:hypothetical protein